MGLLLRGLYECVLTLVNRHSHTSLHQTKQNTLIPLPNGKQKEGHLGAREELGNQDMNESEEM